MSSGLNGHTTFDEVGFAFDFELFERVFHQRPDLSDILLTILWEEAAEARLFDHTVWVVFRFELLDGELIDGRVIVPRLILLPLTLLVSFLLLVCH